MDILAMLKICINTIAYGILAPVMNMPYIIFLFIVLSRYKRTAALQEAVYGRPRTTLKSLLATSVLAGLVAGIGISIFMTLTGVSFSENMGIQYLIILSILLMLIEPRFLCFSYSGGILALISLVFGIDYVDVTGILVLVAVLHLLEAVLIYVDGSRGAIPVFMEGEDGSVVGGFTMQRFWPIPLAIIIMKYGAVSGGSVATPDWWPLIRPYMDPERLKEVFFEALPVAAILGYSEFTTSKLPKEKCRESSLKLALFSITLLALSIISAYVYIFKFIAALFAPIAHEALIERGKRQEKKAEPLFSPVKYGLKVLDTIPEGAGEKMGIMPGDTVVSINNRSIVTEGGLEEFFKEYVTFIWVEIKDRYGGIRTLEYKDYREGIADLGIIIVPPSGGGLMTVRERKSPLKRLIDRFKG